MICNAIESTECFENFKMKSHVNHPTLKNAVGITTSVLIIAFNVTIKL